MQQVGRTKNPVMELDNDIMALCRVREGTRHMRTRCEKLPLRQLLGPHWWTMCGTILVLLLFALPARWETVRYYGSQASWPKGVWSIDVALLFEDDVFSFDRFDIDGWYVINSDRTLLGSHIRLRHGDQEITYARYSTAYVSGSHQAVLNLGIAADGTPMESVSPFGPECCGSMFVFETPAGDATNDGAVEFDDFVILANNFGVVTSNTSWLAYPRWEDGDFDLNNRVDFLDFTLLADNFGKHSAASAASVPEPSSGIVLASLMVFSVAFLRRVFSEVDR